MLLSQPSVTSCFPAGNICHMDCHCRPLHAHTASGHMAFSFLILAPVALLQPWESHQRTLEKQWKGVVYIGCFMVGTFN